MKDFETKTFISGFNFPTNTSTIMKNQADMDNRINCYIRNRSKKGNNTFVVNIDNKIKQDDGAICIYKFVTSYFKD